MTIRRIMFLSGALLAGCVTFGQLEEGLNALVGRHEREAFAALGYPDGKQEFSGETVYVWGRSHNTAMFLPQTSTTTGYVGTRPIYGTTTTTQVVPMNLNCTIKIVVGANSHIRTWEYEGNLGGCAPYINRVREYTKR